MGFFQFETILGIFRHIMASRKTVPPRIFRIVPFGDFHICFRLNSTIKYNIINILGWSPKILLWFYLMTLYINSTNITTFQTVYSATEVTNLVWYEVQMNLKYVSKIILKMQSQPLTRISSGVIVAHLTPTLYFFMALAQSTVTETK